MATFTNNCGQCVNVDSNYFVNGLPGPLASYSNLQSGAAFRYQYFPSQSGSQTTTYEYRVRRVQTCSVQAAPPPATVARPASPPPASPTAAKPVSASQARQVFIHNACDKSVKLDFRRQQLDESESRAGEWPVDSGGSIRLFLNDRLPVLLANRRIEWRAWTEGELYPPGYQDLELGITNRNGAFLADLVCGDFVGRTYATPPDGVFPPRLVTPPSPGFDGSMPFRVERNDFISSWPERTDGRADG